MGSVMRHITLENGAQSRVAQVLLRHAQPKTPDDALRFLVGRMGVYVLDKESLGREVKLYFG